MTQSRCVCGHDEFEHSSGLICCGDFGECECDRFEWDEEETENAP